MTTSQSAATSEFLGLRFARCDLGEALGWVLERSHEPGFQYIVTPNVDHVVRLQRADDPALWEIYRQADLLLCDSRILARLARWSGVNLPVVAGSDLTAGLLSRPLPAGTRVALIGGGDAQHDWLRAARPEAEHFHHLPPMGLRSNPDAQLAAAAFIEAVQPHLILLTVGAPQSEIVAQLVKARGKSRGVALCVGASLEFLTGEKRRAPRILQAMSLEWAFRLLSEPRRLWRRYLVEGPAILAIWLRWRSERGSR
jgi:N-acetylglucosaminyldiphosphoundecaprenol N-acetyl-beta-D-mannosaminyltransferase